jgi:hypothetical protein
MTTTVPLSSIPNQTLSVVLAGQNCVLRLFWRKRSLYLDLDCNNIPIIRGAKCGINHSLVVNPSPDFSGTLFFADTRGQGQDPHYSELGARYLLCYAEDE